MAKVFGGEVVTSCYSTTSEKFSLELLNGMKEPEERDYFVYLCPGYGGYEVLYEGGDGRSWINVKYGNKKSDLFAAVSDNAGGYFPAKSNDVIEWRGVKTEKGFAPYAIIYRVTVSDDEGKKDSTKLMVFSLNKGDSKFLGVVSGKDEGKKARAIADRAKPK